MNKMDRLSYNIQYTKEQVKYMQIDLTLLLRYIVYRLTGEGESKIYFININK